jgi:hypothetical protein
MRQHLFDTCLFIGISAGSALTIYYIVFEDTSVAAAEVVICVVAAVLCGGLKG